MKNVLITGASSGIGLEMAHVYAEKGFDLFLTARREPLLQELKITLEKKHNISVEIFSLDLSEQNSAEVLFAKSNELSLKFDIVINNAGFGLFGDFVDNDPDMVQSMLNLNMLTLTKLCHLYSKQMIEKGGGNIVNIASTAAFQPVPYLAVYAATKSYVLNFSEALAFELKPKNVFVTAICPGATESEFGDTAGFDVSKLDSNMPTSRDLAEFIYKVVKRNKVVAQHGKLNGFLTFTQRFVPRSIVTKVSASMMKK